MLWRTFGRGRAITDGIILDTLIAGAQAGIALAVGAAMAVSRLPVPVRICAALAVATYGLNCLLNSPVGEIIERVEPLWIAAASFSAASGGFTWVMVVALFDDKPVRPVMFIPAAALALSALLLVTAEGTARFIAWWVANIFGVLVALSALYILARGRETDLVESRRRLRRFLFWACIAMGVAQVALLLFAQGRAHAWTYRGIALAELLAFGFMASALLELRRAVFDPPPARPPRDDPDADLILALNQVMDQQEAWREEGLSIGALAARLNVPEHRLRRVINGRLGHSNFPSFVNGYRIEAAKRRLADPAEKDRPVAQIAFDLGFTSLSPFNRAFKEATGLTPTAWRRSPPLTADGN